MFVPFGAIEIILQSRSCSNSRKRGVDAGMPSFRIVGAERNRRVRGDAGCRMHDAPVFR